jgi:hypothetical protein
MLAVVYARVKVMSNMFVEHVRGSRWSRGNQVRGHAYSTVKGNEHTRLGHRNHDRRWSNTHFTEPDV